MSEIENCVEVKVSGPKSQIDVYVNWLKTTTEHRIESGFNKHIWPEDLALTHSQSEDLCWKYLSSNIKRKIKSMYRWKLDVLEYRVNYMVYYGTYTLKDGTVVIINAKDFKRAIYPELVNAFNPIPEIIATRCPDLNFEIYWESYYVERDFMCYEFEGDRAI